MDEQIRALIARARESGKIFNTQVEAGSDVPRATLYEVIQALEDVERRRAQAQEWFDRFIGHASTSHLESLKHQARVKILVSALEREMKQYQDDASRFAEMVRNTSSQREVEAFEAFQRGCLERSYRIREALAVVAASDTEASDAS